MSKNDSILEGLKKAMQAEADGHNFYKMAANSISDETGKETFDSLAKDEVDHFKFLKAQYDSFEKNGRPDMEAKLGKPSEFEESPIFSEDFKKRLHDAHYEMTALSIGVQLELASIKFYESESAKATDKTVKKFYKELAEWETTHHRRLLKEQQELTEEYWQAGHFYPF